MQVLSLDEFAGYEIIGPARFDDASLNNELFSSVREILINDKMELYEYLRYDFSQIFFNQNYV